MTVLYNELEPYAAAWLGNLINAGHIARGTVDARSIRDLAAADVVAATQFHAFAGIGVWSYALRLAGWPDDRPAWTGSCPCQPFSDAGDGLGFDDPRHLWPVWFNLIRECRPAVVLGEQVASRAGLAWLDLVRADLEGEGYAVGAADLCAAGVGAPHIRQRLFFGAVRVADRLRPRLEGLAGHGNDRHQPGRLDTVAAGPAAAGGAVGGMAHDGREGRGQIRALDGWRGGRSGAEGVGERPVHGGACGVADTDREREHGAGRGAGRRPQPADGRRPDAVPNPWADCAWVPCRDGKARPVEPGTFPLAHGAPARVGRLRAFGNAIVGQVAAAFVTAFVEAVGLTFATEAA